MVGPGSGNVRLVNPNAGRRIESYVGEGVARPGRSRRRSSRSGLAKPLMQTALLWPQGGFRTLCRRFKCLPSVQ